MNSIQELAQWVIDNRYPKSEQEKISDLEMYHQIVDSLKKMNRNDNYKIQEIPDILNKIGDCIDNEVENGGSIEQISDVIKLMKGISEDNWMFIIQ